MHKPGVAKALMTGFERANESESKQARTAILETLARLYHKEAPYDASWWWNTRPDTHGPYYKTILWEDSPLIEQFFLDLWGRADFDLQTELSALDGKHRLEMEALATAPEPEATVEVLVDLDAIQRGAGEVGSAAIEDVLVAITTLTPDLDRGRTLFGAQGCVACHTLTAAEKPKGPYMGQIGSIMKADQIAESILRPNASISQGFASVMLHLKDGTSLGGFVTAESAKQLTLRDISGGVTEVQVDSIASREEQEQSMMPAGLSNALSLQDFASLVGFLASQK